MRILITTPSLTVPHGGTRVLNEWASGLSRLGHTVALLVNSGEPVCNWYKIPAEVIVTKDKNMLQWADIVIIGSPHSIYLARGLKPTQKVFIFLQMIEHLFKPDDSKFYQKCLDTYTSPYPLICISKWNADMLRRQFGRTGKIYYIGNGINLNDFPVEQCQKDGKTILVEGWECNNPTKDTEHIAPRVAKKLKEQGYTILAYGQKPLTTMADVPHEYYQQPSLDQLNELYRRATILLKASKYDARSTAPIEAMTKGTPTVRAIIKGDDDLIGSYNCARVEYSFDEMLRATQTILTNEYVNEMMCKVIAANCIDYVKIYNWDYWLPIINELICKNGLSSGAVAEL